MLSNQIAKRLGRGEELSLRAIIVVAHPDDEVLFASAVLRRLDDVCLIHVFDGSCPNSPGELAMQRRIELTRALQHLGCKCSKMVSLGYPDSVGELPDPLQLAVDILRHVEGTDLIISHSLEGGHPAHDCTAMAMQVVADDVPQIPRVEFVAYGPSGHRPNLAGTIRMRMSAAEIEQKRRALQCFESQSEIIDLFHPAFEWIRPV